MRCTAAVKRDEKTRREGERERGEADGGERLGHRRALPKSWLAHDHDAWIIITTSNFSFKLSVPPR